MTRIGLLDGIEACDVVRSPYPHVVAENRLDPVAFDQLAREFPDVATLTDGRDDFGDKKFSMYASELLPAGHLSSMWREFTKIHMSQTFFRKVVSLFSADIRAFYPDLEDRVGKPIEAFSVGWNDRSIKKQSSRAPVDHDISMEIGFSHDYTHVERRARGAHVDHNCKLFAGLLYFRFPDDNTRGGDLELCGPKRGQERRLFAPQRDVIWHDSPRTVDDDAVFAAQTVPFRQNQFVLFLNTYQSIHRVSPREPSPIPRRHVYFSGRVTCATSEKPLFRVVPPPRSRVARYVRSIGRRLLSELRA